VTRPCTFLHERGAPPNRWPSWAGAARSSRVRIGRLAYALEPVRVVPVPRRVRLRDACEGPLSGGEAPRTLGPAVTRGAASASLLSLLLVWAIGDPVVAASRIERGPAHSGSRGSHGDPRLAERSWDNPSDFGATSPARLRGASSVQSSRRATQWRPPKASSRWRVPPRGGTSTAGSRSCAARTPRTGR